MTVTPFVVLNEVEKRWNGQLGVEDISLSIPEGSFTALLGPSGCGKSTTLRLLAGLELPDSGQIMIVNDAPRVALTENENNTPWDDDWHTVKLIRNSKSGKITIYFDDMKKPHMTVIDKTFGRGQIGIGSFDDMNDFDDVRLYGR